jgi:hypothetical protein
MGIYWAAFDHEFEEVLRPPSNANNKVPRLYMPLNPFPNMLCMKLAQGHEFELLDDTYMFYHDHIDKYKDITEETYKEWLQHVKLTDEQFRKMQNES